MSINASFLHPTENSVERIHVDPSNRKSLFSERTKAVLGSFNVTDRTSSSFDR